MNVEKANKIIAKYMGLDVHAWDQKTGAVYYREMEGDVRVEKLITYASLDRLIPVVLKTGEAKDHDTIWLACMFAGLMKNAKAEVFQNPRLKIEEATCIAVAKSIELLG